MSTSSLSLLCSRTTHTGFITTGTGRHIFHRGLATQVSTPPQAPPPRPNLHTAVILNRSPILTRTPTSFERAYYAYQARIQRALHNPFPHDFYFKPGSLLESKFNLEERKRDRKAFGPGFGADHPLAPGAGLTAQDLKKFGRDEDETPAPRVHASDASGDVKSLDRKGQRNLYLLIQQQRADSTDAAAAAATTNTVWKFPEIVVSNNELLHEVSTRSPFFFPAGYRNSCTLQSAARDLKELCGEAMDAWIVSRNPIGLYEIHPATPPVDPAAPQKVLLIHLRQSKIDSIVGRLAYSSSKHTSWLVK